VAEAKGAGDYVTEVDRASEHAIREVLGQGTPDIPWSATSRSCLPEPSSPSARPWGRAGSP